MTDRFHGMPTRSIANQYLRLDYLASGGPRIVRLLLAGTAENLLAEVPDLTLSTPLGAYALIGGHRLWHAPEGMPRSYAPEAGVEVEASAAAVRLTQPTETLTGIRKRVEIQLSADRPAVTVRHELRNEGVWPVELAPWAITMLPLGGLAILPQQVGALDAPGLLPNRHLVLWPYTRWSDPRLQLGDDYVLIRAEALLPPCKVGYLNRQGWVAYQRNGVLFVKRFGPRLGAPHADFGCNVEAYCGDRFIEVETLGPLARLEPGEAVAHVETWEVHPGVEAEATPESIHAALQRLGLAGGS